MKTMMIFSVFVGVFTLSTVAEARVEANKIISERVEFKTKAGGTMSNSFWTKGS